MSEINYAEKTSVPVEKTQFEIQQLLKKFNVNKMAFLYDENTILFELYGKSVKLRVRDPNINDPKIQTTPTGKQRKGEAIQKLYQQKLKQKWRILYFLLKAAIVSIQAEVMTAEEFFLPYFITKTGETVSEVVLPQLGNSSVPLLP